MIFREYRIHFKKQTDIKTISLTFAKTNAMKIFSKFIHEKPGLSWLLIVGIIILLYLQTVQFDILYNFDDDAYVKDIRISELSVKNVQTYFSEYFLGMYQPIPVFSFALINKIFPESIFAQRILNILLHCINTLLVLIVVRKISSNAWIGWLSALIFAVHPMHVESVTWLSTRSNLIFTAFYLLGIHFYLKMKSDQAFNYFLIVLVFFLLALFSKVTAATLPFILVLLHWNKNSGFSFRSYLHIIPFLLISAGFILIGIKASGAFGHISELEISYSIIDRITLVLNALWLYLAKAIFPSHISAIYLFPILEGNSLPVSYYYFGVLSLLTITTALYYGYNRVKKFNDKSILFGLLFFLLTISIVLPLKWSRTILIADRYTYLPYIGIFYSLLFLAFRFIRNSIPTTIIMSSFLGIYILILSYLAFERNKVWETPITLFTNVIQNKRAPAEIAMGHYNRANEYVRLKLPENAERDYSSAIQANQKYSEAYFNRGLLYYNSGLMNESIVDFTEAIKHKPTYTDAYINRGVAYRATGAYENALQDFNYVIRTTQDGKAYFNRGVLYYLNLHDSVQSCADWQKAYEKGIEQANELLQMYCR